MEISRRMGSLDLALSEETAQLVSSLASNQPDIQSRLKSCALEFFRTEKSYLAKLQVVNCQFHRRLRAHLTYDDSEFSDGANYHYGVMFEYAQSFIECHQEFLSDLKIAAKSMKFLLSLGEIFTKFAQKSCDKYIAYALSYPDITNLLTRQQRNNRRFNEFVFVSEMCAGESLDSLRMAPIQRIPRYKLMLSELQQLCPELTPQSNSIHVAIEQCLDMMERIDDSIHQGEKIAQVRVIQDIFFDGQVNLMDYRRRFIKSGELTKLFNRQKAHISRGKLLKFFLFSDCLLYCDLDKRHKCRHVIHLSQMKIVNSDSNASFIEIISNIKSLVLLPKDVEDRLEWIHAFKSTLPYCDPLPPMTNARNFEAFIKTPCDSSVDQNRGYSRSFSFTLLNRDYAQFKRRGSLPSQWFHASRIRSLTNAVFGGSVLLKPALSNIMANEA